MRKLAIVFFAAAMTMCAADVTGRWSGAFNMTLPNGEKKPDRAFFDLKQVGNDLTGKAGPSADENWEIRNGRISGDDVTFEVAAEEMVLVFKLKVEGEHLKGQARAESPQGVMTAEVDMEQEK